jgi:hypothetical protein
MLNSIERYRDFQAWIPSTDIDGIDAKNTFFGTAKNIDFHNGFFTPAIAPTEIVYPSIIRTATLTQLFEILSIKHFYHSTEGNCFLYILYKLETVNGAPHHSYRIILDSSISGIHELYTNPQYLDLDHSADANFNLDEKPVNITYSIAIDQLKINLNVTATYLGGGFGGATDKKVMMNLTLVYLSERTYNTYKRNAGWYLFPRWLGWSYDLTLGDETTEITIDDDFVYDEPVAEGAIDYNKAPGYLEDFEDMSYLPNLTLSNMARVQLPPSYGSYYAYLENTSANPIDTEIGTIFITGLKRLKSIRFKIVYRIGESNHQIKVWVTDETTLIATNLKTLEIDPTSIANNYILDIPVNMFQDTNFGLAIESTVKAKVDSEAFSSYVGIDNLKLIGYNDLSVVVRNQDIQRGLIKITNHSGCYNDLYLNIPKEQIDWRTTAYEIYSSTDNQNIKYLFSRLTVDSSTAWDITTDPDYVRKLITERSSYADLETLNFNYGLGIVKVFTDEDDIIGKQIDSEIFYRNRTYYVKGDDKIYQSHISGTGQPQPDSFPFSEVDNYGFIIPSRNFINKAIAITPLDEISIITDEDNYCYIIEAGQSVNLRRIRATNGGQGISSVKSLLTKLGGMPYARSLIWEDSWGMFGYTGGINAPKNLVEETHQNYWNEITQVNKNSAVAVYNKAKDEYWLQIGDEVIIYEFKYNRFKNYVLPYKIKEFIGIKDDLGYFLADNGKMYKIDLTGTNTLEAEIETHYSTNTMMISGYPVVLPQSQDKILQEIYIQCKEDQPGQVEYIVTFDDNTLETIKLLTIRNDLVFAPLLVRYGKIKIKLKLPPYQLIITEFGYTYNVPEQHPAQGTFLNVEGLGLDSGQVAGVGL